MKLHALPVIFLLGAALPLSFAQSFYASDNSASFCTDFTFEDNTSKDSPELSSCNDFVSTYEQNLVVANSLMPLNYTHFGRPQKSVLSSNDCTLKLQHTGDLDNLLLGNSDALKIVQTSMDEFGADIIDGDKTTRRVGAKGTMKCYGLKSKRVSSEGPFDVTWEVSGKKGEGMFFVDD